jgi:hypothetical protein
MWSLAKESLPHGRDSRRRREISARLDSPGTHIRTNGQLVLESKRERVFDEQ